MKENIINFKIPKFLSIISAVVLTIFGIMYIRKDINYCINYDYSISIYDIVNTRTIYLCLAVAGFFLFKYTAKQEKSYSSSNNIPISIVVFTGIPFLYCTIVAIRHIDLNYILEACWYLCLFAGVCKLRKRKYLAAFVLSVIGCISGIVASLYSFMLILGNILIAIAIILTVYAEDYRMCEKTNSVIENDILEKSFEAEFLRKLDNK